MAQIPLYGVESIEIGTPGANGAMGATMERITPVAEGSVSMTQPEPQKTDIKAEDVAGVIKSIAQDPDATTFTFASLDLSNANCVRMLGGTVDAATNTFSAPTTASFKELSIRMTTRESNGVKHIFNFPLCSTYAVFDGAFTKTDVLRIRLTAALQTPFDVNGVALPPYTKQEVAVG